MRYVIDVSTALRWVGHNAVGIVRTEREIAKHFLSTRRNVELIYFDRDDVAFRCATHRQIAALFPDIERPAARRRDASAAADDGFAFLVDDVLISAGLQWDIDFLGAVYAEKKHTSIKIVQVVYDIIPILMPEYCVPGMDVLFPKFIIDTVWTADVVYAISDSTRNDFIDYAGTLNVGRVPPVRRITLGCDLPERTGSGDRVDGLEPGKFVIYVSTIEPRKNHKMIFDIWRLLSKRRGGEIPTLVFIGGKGWNTENLFVSLENCVSLYPHKINIMNSVSDQQLQWLYDNAMFTLYPSLYEGWGLPIAESLARGTPCIASNSSSIPEVAGEFCELIDPNDFVDWTKKIDHYITNVDALAERRRLIESTYKIETWQDAMSRFGADLESLAVQWDGER